MSDYTNFGLARQGTERDAKRLLESTPDDLDSGIAAYVLMLRAWGVETCQSCQGGPGHSYPEPTVDFVGDDGAGYYALGVAITHAMPVASLSRVWNVYQGQVYEVVWRLTFSAPCGGDSRPNPIVQGEETEKTAHV